MPRSSTSRRPRRRPARSSGRAIVDAILTASALLLERDGIGGLSTNAIARVAGVSVGSVYQYFPDKLTIVAELARRLELSGRDFVVPQLDWMREADMREVAWRIAGLVDDPALGSLSLRRAILREVPRAWILETVRTNDATLETLLAGFLTNRRGDVRDAPCDELAFVTLHALDGVVEGSILLEPALLGSLALRVELFSLLWRYVAPEGADLSMPEASHTRHAHEASTGEPSASSARLAGEPSRRIVITPGEHVPTERGRATRRTIMEATERLLARGGVSSLSARAIAREAGVAPGALYHYFRNTESLVAELGLEQERRMRAAITELTARVEPGDVRQGIEALVRTYVAPDGEERERRRCLMAEVPRRWAEEASLETQRIARRRLGGALAARRDEIRGGDHELMAFVACRAVEGVVEAWLLCEHPWSSERLVGALTDLVVRYVRGARRAASRLSPSGS